MAYLILIRHGESEWNAKGLWTGWTDVNLTDKGRREARTAGQAIKNIPINHAFTSKLKRAKQTLEEIESELQTNNFPVVENRALNERDYGQLTGKNKWLVKKEYGAAQWQKWRRGWDEPLPGGETLKDVYLRVVPYYKEIILPKIESGQNVLISAHGNSLRALVKFLEDVPDDKIPRLEIPTGQVYIYQINTDGKVTSKKIITPRVHNLVHHLARKMVGKLRDHGRAF